jgi:glycogen(starch) synthase
VPGDETVGLRFRACDADALRVLLERVLEDDSERLRLVAEAREHVLSFNWVEVARRTRAVYEAMVPQRAATR